MGDGLPPSEHEAKLFNRNESEENLGFGVKVIKYERWTKYVFNQIFGGYNEHVDTIQEFYYENMPISQTTAEEILRKGRESENEVLNKGINHWNNGYKATDLFVQQDEFLKAKQSYIEGVDLNGNNSTLKEYAYGKDGIDRWLNENSDKLHNKGVELWNKGYKETDLFKQQALWVDAKQHYIAGAREQSQDSTKYKYAYDKDGIDRWLNENSDKLLYK